MKTTIRMVGHGVDLTIDAGDWHGNPSFATTPEYIRNRIEVAYRQVAIGRLDGGVGWLSSRIRSRQLEPQLHRQAMAMTLSLWCADSKDNVGRQDPNTCRTFRFYTTHDYRD